MVQSQQYVDPVDQAQFFVDHGYLVAPGQHTRPDSRNDLC
jgi:hypothetical protein